MKYISAGYHQWNISLMLRCLQPEIPPVLTVMYGVNLQM